MSVFQPTAFVSDGDAVKKLKRCLRFCSDSICLCLKQSTKPFQSLSTASRWIAVVTRVLTMFTIRPGALVGRPGRVVSDATSLRMSTIRIRGPPAVHVAVISVAVVVDNDNDFVSVFCLCRVKGF